MNERASTRAVRVACLSIVFVLAARAWSQETETRPALPPPAVNLDPEDPLNDLSSRMAGIAAQLESGKSGPSVSRNQTDVVDQLDAMIAALRKKSGS